MGITLRELPGDPRAASLDERDKGDKFERLIKAYLETDPERTERFSEVWQWTAWPGRGDRRRDRPGRREPWPERLHRLLADDKVLVLAVDSGTSPRNPSRPSPEPGEIRIDESTTLLGCWNGLAKKFGPEHGDASRPWPSAQASGTRLRVRSPQGAL